MRKSFFILTCLVLPAIFSFAQSIDSVKKVKWINYKRAHGIRDPGYGRRWAEKTYVTDNKDTLKRGIIIDRNSDDILWETSYVNGKKNGLEIHYYPNGIIASVNYYLDGKIWETISAADTSGKLLYPGSLHDGNGTKIEYTTGIYNTWLTTYKAGLPEGLFYTVHDGDTITGNLTYKPSAVNYFPAQKCTYINDRADTVTDIFYDDEFNKFFKDSSFKGFGTLLSSKPDSLPEQYADYIYLDGLSFDDIASIPVGKWISRSTKSKTVHTVIHDDNGNAIRDTYTDGSGKVLSDRKFPPCGKRKVVKRNADGSFYSEACL